MPAVRPAACDRRARGRILEVQFSRIVGLNVALATARRVRGRKPRVVPLMAQITLIPPTRKIALPKFLVYIIIL